MLVFDPSFNNDICKQIQIFFKSYAEIEPNKILNLFKEISEKTWLITKIQRTELICTITSTHLHEKMKETSADLYRFGLIILLETGYKENDEKRRHMDELIKSKEPIELLCQTKKVLSLFEGSEPLSLAPEICFNIFQISDIELQNDIIHAIGFIPPKQRDRNAILGIIILMRDIKPELREACLESISKIFCSIPQNYRAPIVGSIEKEKITNPYDAWSFLVAACNLSEIFDKPEIVQNLAGLFKGHAEKKFHDSHLFIMEAAESIPRQEMSADAINTLINQFKDIEKGIQFLDFRVLDIWQNLNKIPKQVREKVQWVIANFTSFEDKIYYINSFLECSIYFQCTQKSANAFFTILDGILKLQLSNNLPHGNVSRFLQSLCKSGMDNVQMLSQIFLMSSIADDPYTLRSIYYLINASEDKNNAIQLCKEITAPNTCFTNLQDHIWFFRYVSHRFLQRLKEELKVKNDILQILEDPKNSDIKEYFIKRILHKFSTDPDFENVIPFFKLDLIFDQLFADIMHIALKQKWNELVRAYLNTEKGRNSFVNNYNLIQKSYPLLYNFLLENFPPNKGDNYRFYPLIVLTQKNTLYIASTLSHPYKEPKKTLLELAKNLNKNIREIVVEYTGEAGVDDGGLGRDFISKIFGSLRKENCIIDGIPIYDFQEDQEEIYRAIGEVFAFLLCSKRRYPIGSLFHKNLFRGLQAFSREEAKGSFDELSRHKKIEVFCILYPQFNTKEVREFATQEKLFNHFSEGYNVENRLKLIHCIAQGLAENESAWLKMQTLGSQFSSFISGESSKIKLQSQILFGKKISDNIKNSFFEWLNEATNESLEFFLAHVTGAPAIPEDMIKINCFEELDRPHVHSCFSRIDLPIEITGDGLKAFLYSLETTNLDDFPLE